MAPASFEVAVLLVVGCTLVGLVLLAVEVVLVPGLGLPGVLGTAFLVLGVVFAFAQGGALWGALTLGSAAAILVLGLRALNLTVGHRVVLGDRLAAPPPRELDVLLGRAGVTLSPLHPVGIARFGLRRVDVQSLSEYLEPGADVVVTEVEGNRVLVERAPQ